MNIIKFVEKIYLYILIAVVPLIIYTIKIDNFQIDQRTIRLTAFYNFAIIAISFLEKNLWLRYFLFYCVINWWMHFFMPFGSDVTLNNILSAYLIYIGVKHLIRNKYLNIETILKIFCGTTIFQLIWMIVQSLNIDPVFHYVNVYGERLPYKIPLVGWSGNPCVLGVSLAITSFLFFQYFRIKKFPVLFFITLIAALFVRNATTVLCFSGGLLFYILCKYRNKWIYSASFIIAVLTVLFLIFVKHPNLDRLPIWQAMVPQILKHPLVGFGLDSFRMLKVIIHERVPVLEAHNDYLQILFELGGIGLILFLGFVGSIFYKFFKFGFSNRQLCIMSGLIAYLISGLTIFPMHLAQLSFYAVVMLACLMSEYEANI